ncbi:MAG: hypothetical protein ABEJ42_07230 [Halobacteriaceae archaeon]
MSAGTLQRLLDVAVVVGEVVAGLLAAGAGLLLETDAVEAMGTNLTMAVWYTVFGGVLLAVGWQLFTDARARRAAARVGST